MLPQEHRHVYIRMSEDYLMKTTSTLDDVELFAIVVAAGNFSEAGRRVGLTASSVARRISDLEEALGAVLLTRTTRRMGLTEAGSMFYARAARITLELVEAKAEVAGLDAEPRGKLRVNASNSFGSRHVASVLGDLVIRYPQLSIDLNLDDACVDLVETRTHVAIRLGRLPDSSLVATKLAPQRRVVVGSPAYFARRPIPQVPDDLADQDCLVIQNCPARSWHFIDPKEGGARLYPVNGRVTANSGESLIAATLAGAGLAHLPSWLVYEHVKEGSVIPVLQPFYAGEETHGGIYAVRPASGAASGKVKAFVQLLRERFGQPPFWDLIYENGPRPATATAGLRLVT
jgi:DNA-binding transcriptional LysR family regulator